MFAVIKTNGATHIAIYVPAVGSDKSLPAIARMLENNATFVQRSWREIKTVEPEMSITLGDRFSAEEDGQEVIIAESGAVIGEEFVTASPDIFVSNAKVLKTRDDEISRLRTELSFVKSELAAAKEAAQAIADAE